jgi:hypothetical protein
LTKDKTFIIPNIQDEARMFEWAGVSFGEDKTYLLSKAIKVHILSFNQLTLLIFLINYNRD